MTRIRCPECSHVFDVVQGVRPVCPACGYTKGQATHKPHVPPPAAASSPHSATPPPAPRASAPAASPLALGAFFAALGALLLAWVPFAGIPLAVVLGVIAVLLGMAVLRRIRQTSPRPRDAHLTIIAFVLAVVALPLALIFHFAVWDAAHKAKTDITVLRAHCEPYGNPSRYNLTVEIDNIASKTAVNTAVRYWNGVDGVGAGHDADSVRGPLSIEAGTVGKVYVHFKEQACPPSLPFVRLQYSQPNWDHHIEADVPSS